MTPQEALDRIAALCDKADAAQFASAPIGTLATFHLREVLAEVSPEPGGDVRDRYHEEANAEKADLHAAVEARALIRELEGCVRPAAIDRDALTGELRLGWSGEYDDGYGHRNPATVYLSEGAIRTLADRLVRPVAGVAVVDRSSGREVGGVVLTPEEADDLEAVLQLGLDVYMDSARGPRLRALAARLEAAS